MASQAPPQKRPAAARPDQLPDERFWVKYSPNHELPLSSVASLAWHVLALVVIVLVGWVYSLSLRKELPIEPVEMVGSLPGSGVGGQNGSGGPGTPAAVPEAIRPNATAAKAPDVVPKANDLPPVLDKVTLPELPQDSDRVLTKQAEDARKLAARLGQLKELKGSDSQSGGAPGAPGANGPGAGGPGGGGAGNDLRVRRQVRWTLSFTTESGEDYLRQLAYLKAVLFIEVPGEGTKMYRQLDMAPPIPAEPDEPAIHQRLSWRDEQQHSVAPLARAMGIVKPVSKVTAYFPPALEEELLKKEKRASGGKPEDKIRSTIFQLVRTGNRYDIIVVAQDLVR